MSAKINALACLLPLLTFFVAAGENEINADEEFKRLREIRAVETYVPYEEFLKISGDPNATIMTLEEYRGLVELATARNAAKPLVLPPLDASLMEARYAGVAGEQSVRFDVQFKFALAGKGWRRLDLGPLPNLGRVTLDGKPGWVLFEAGRAALLVHGEGVHSGTLTFALPLQINEDMQSVAGELLNAAASEVKLTVPGRAVPKSGAGALDPEYDTAADTTTFTVPAARVNGAIRFDANWKRKFDAQKSTALLQAEHQVSYLLNPASPSFYWKAAVQVSRGRVAEFEFDAPPGCRIVRLSGPQVHSWRQTGSVVNVLLNDALQGEFTFVAGGFLDAPPPAGFELGAPQLRGAKRNANFIALYEPDGMTLAITKSDGLRELALDERPALSPSGHRLMRMFFVERPGALVGVSVKEWKTIFDTQTAASLLLREKSLLLVCAISIQPERGRIYSLNLSVPAEWKIERLEERTPAPNQRGLSAEKTTATNEDAWTLTLRDAADAGHPLELLAVLMPREREKIEAVWENFALSFALPAVGGARRVSNRIAVVAQPSIEVAFGAMPEWRSTAPGELARLGIEEPRLRAGLSSETPGAELKLALSRKTPRGEYESMTHVQTMEREMWVRDDIRLVVLDRAVDELTFSLPAEAAEPILIQGEGVREVIKGAAANQRIARFERSWQGARRLRVEYRAPLDAGKETPIPDIRIEGNFDSKRGVIFQSTGVVLLEVKPGDSLLTAAVDEKPDFAMPWKTGRTLYAFKFGAGNKNGFFRTQNLERSATLGILASELKLATVLDESGMTRTHVDFLLEYARTPFAQIRLPEGARVAALRVDGEIVRPVREASGAGEARGSKSASRHTPGEQLISVPLPPRSQAHIELVFEREYKALGGWGSIELDAPDLEGVPVGVTRWSFYHPSSFKLRLAGGNVTEKVRRVPNHFLTQLMARARAGEFAWSAWSGEAPEYEVSVTVETLANEQRQSVQIGNALKAQETQAAENRDAGRERSLGGLALPEGAELSVAKLGGSARATLAYYNIGYGKFARRAVFLCAVFAGLWLLLKYSLRAAVLFTVIGLFLGILVPLALEWESPLFAVPFCEGLTALAAILLLRGLWLMSKVSRAKRAEKLAATAACVLALLSINGARAGETLPEPVLIPFAKNATLPLDANPKEMKAYVPKAVFAELMKRVKPEEKKEPEIDAPKTLGPKPEIVAVSLGNADYTATIDEKTYTIKGRIEVRTFNAKGWARVFLDTGPSRLTSLKIDGEPAGVSHEAGRPFVVLKGEKQFVLELELSGKLDLEAARAVLAAQVVPGGATRVSVPLPPNVELDAKALPSGAWVVKNAEGKAERVELQLGATGVFTLAWHAPNIAEAGKTQLGSTSYTRYELGADGYAIVRFERLSASNTPMDQFSYAVLGDWELANVSAPGLSEWTVTGEGAARRLRLWFRKPISEAIVRVDGWAALGTAEAPAAGLSLEGAARQEGFVGLKHGEGRRFTAASLSGMKRASQQELAQAVALGEGAIPDRILQFYGTIENARVQAESDPLQTALETQIVGVVQSGKLLASVRTQYTSAGRAPLRHEVELPAGWEVRTVRGNLLRDWEIVEAGGTRKLVVHFNGRATSGTEVLWSAEMPLNIPATGALKLELPQPRASVALKAAESVKAGESSKISETVEWVLAAEPAVSISRGADTTMQDEPVERAPRWVNLRDGPTYRLAFRSLKADTKLSVELSRQSSAAQAVVVSFVRAAEDHLQVNARVRFKIEGAGRERFTLTLPASARLTSLEAKNLRGKELSADGRVVTVILQSAISGEQLVDLSYRLPREPGKDAVASPLALDPNEVQSVEHFAGLLQIDNVVTLDRSTRLTPIKEAEDLPFLPAGVSKNALTEVFAGEPDWTMTLHERGMKTETGEAAEVLFAELKTALGADGSVRSMATYTVRNRSLQFLPIELPGDAQLWAVFVGGEPTTVSHEKRAGETVLLIPLRRMGLVDLPETVSIVFESAPLALPAAYISFAPKAPRVLDAPVAETYWTLYLPAGYEASRADGNMKEVLGTVLYGGKVKAIVSELERQTKIAEAPGQSLSVRRRVFGNTMQLRQQLDDDVSRLESTDGAQTQSYLRRNKQADLEVQQQFNIDNARAGNYWQQKLGAKPEEREAAIKNEQQSEESRLFLDQFYFLENRWRMGRAVREPGRGVATGGVGVDDLRFMRRPAGFRPGELPGRIDAENEMPKEQGVGEGLREERPGVAGVEGGRVNFKRVEDAAPELGMTTMTFSRSVEGQPELVLTLRSTRETARYVALALLALAVLGAWFYRRKIARA